MAPTLELTSFFVIVVYETMNGIHVCVHVHVRTCQYQCPCPCSLSMSMLYVRVSVAHPCPCCMSMSMLRGQVDAAYPSRCCMSMYVLHLYVRAACPRSCCMFISLLHVIVHNGSSCPCCISMFMPACRMFTLLVAVYPCCMFMLYARDAYPHVRLPCMSLFHVHSVPYANAACSCCMPMGIHAPCPHLYAAFPFCLCMLLVCCMSMLLSTLHAHALCP